MIEDNSKKNRVQFTYGSHTDVVTFMSLPSFYEVFITIQPTKCESRLHEICSDVKEAVMRALKYSTPNILRCKMVDPEIAFECAHGGHLCIVNSLDDPPVSLKCQQKAGCAMEIKKEHLVWYRQVNY